MESLFQGSFIEGTDVSRNVAMYAMLISVEKGIENVRVKKGKPKLGPKIAIFVKCFLNSDFITAWCWCMFIVPCKNRCFF